MEVKLSITSSRRISFASDYKEFDVEVNEIENDNYSNGNRSDDEDEDSFGYVNCFLGLLKVFLHENHTSFY